MIGRDAELATLEQTLKGGSALVLISGGPRSGKSRLLWEFRSKLEGPRYKLIPDASPELDVAPWLAINKQLSVEEFRRQVGDTAGPDDDAESITERGREVVLIYGYRPQFRFHQWFTGEFIPALSDAKPPRTVVLAGGRADVKELLSLAQQCIELGPLSRDAVVAELHRISDTLVQPLKGDEVSAYADAISNDPSLLDAMRLLLPLTGSLEPAASGR